MKTFSFQHFLWRILNFLSVSLFLLFVSCKPSLSIKAGNNDEAQIFFSTGFSAASARTIQSVSGGDSESPLFNKKDVISLLESAGMVSVTANLPSATEVTTSAKIPELSKNPLAQTGLLSTKEKTLSLALGPKQISAFYELLNEDGKSYLDLLMIPALIGEKMTTSEYRELLASMYGPSFADEIVNGKLSIQLVSPDGKKSLKKEISLGELLTAENELIWSLRF